MKLILRVLVNAVALWTAAELVDRIELSSDLWSILVVAIVFGLVNAILGPIARLLSFPLVVFTLGLFTLVVNALLLQVTDALTKDLTVDGFWPAVLGALVISLVSWALSIFIPDDRDHRREG